MNIRKVKLMAMILASGLNCFGAAKQSDSASLVSIEFNRSMLTKGQSTSKNATVYTGMELRQLGSILNSEFCMPAGTSLSLHMYALESTNSYKILNLDQDKQLTLDDISYMTKCDSIIVRQIKKSGK
jgi:hypothetical protein